MKTVNSAISGICLFLLSALTFTSSAIAQKTIIIDDDTGVYPLEGVYLEYLEDKDKQLNIDDVISDNNSCLDLQPK